MEETHNYKNDETPVVEDDIYTKDGTVDLRNNPVVKTNTGSWKACRFILGIHPFPIPLGT